MSHYDERFEDLCDKIREESYEGASDESWCEEIVFRICFELNPGTRHEVYGLDYDPTEDVLRFIKKGIRKGEFSKDEVLEALNELDAPISFILEVIKIDTYSVFDERERFEL